MMNKKQKAIAVGIKRQHIEDDLNRIREECSNDKEPCNNDTLEVTMRLLRNVNYLRRLMES